MTENQKNSSINLKTVLIILSLVIIAGCEELPQLQYSGNSNQSGNQTLIEGTNNLIGYTNHLADQAREQVITFDRQVELYSKYDSVCFMFFCKEDCMKAMTKIDDIEARTDFCYNDCGSLDAFDKYAAAYPECKKSYVRNISSDKRYNGMA